MKLRPLVLICIVVVILAACDTTESTPEATATLRGAIVPTRASPTPTNTITPSPTATTDFTATAETIATATQEAQETLDAQATADTVSTLRSIATQEAQETMNAVATQDAQVTNDALATATAEMQMTLDAEASITAAAMATLDAQATLEAQGTQDAQATTDAIAAINAQATSNAVATQDAVVPTDTPEPTSPTSDLPIGGEIAYGESVQSFIGGENFAGEYMFDATEGDVITISMERLSGDLDPFLALLDPEGAEITFNDDRLDVADSRDSLIEGFAIRTTGTHTIVATRFSRDVGTTQGEFRLTLNRDTEGLVITGGTISYGQTVTGAIQPGSTAVEVTFEATAGDVITIEMNRTNGNLDPFVVLVDPNGNEIAEADDHPTEDTQDSYLPSFTIPETGTYRIIATRFSRELGLTQGTFELILTEASASLADATSITYGDTVTGEITDDVPRVDYQFTGTEGDVVSVAMRATSGNLDSFVALIDPSGVEVVNNDDDPQGGGTTDSHIRNFTLPSTGTYTIVATRFNRDLGLSTGSFEVTMELVDVGENIAISPQSTVNIGDTINGQITMDDPFQMYTFQGNAGQTITVSMDQLTNDLDPFLILLDPQGRQIARNDDRSDNDFDALLDNITLESDGEYTIVATRYNRNFGESSGAFEMQLTESEGDTDAADFTSETAIGSVINGTITGEISELYYTFEAQAGDIVTIEMRALDDEFDPYLILEDARGNRLFTNDDNVLDDNISNSGILNMVLSESGFYTIVASAYTDSEGIYTPGDFQLTLSSEGNAGDSGPIPLRAALNNFFSYGDRADDFTEIYYAAGDWVDNEDVDHEIAAFLTYQLPEFDGEVDFAVLDLSECYLTDDSIFDSFGTLYVRLNRLFNSTLDLDAVVNPNAGLVGEINNCTTVDVTQAVRDAYAEGRGFIQFHLAFEDSDVLSNNEIDSVIFVSPYLDVFPAE